MVPVHVELSDRICDGVHLSLWLGRAPLHYQSRNSVFIHSYTHRCEHAHVTHPPTLLFVDLLIRLKVREHDIYIPPFTGKPGQRRLIIRSGPYTCSTGQH